MIKKITNKMLLKACKVQMNIDDFFYKSSMIQIKGWIFSKRDQVKNVHILLTNSKGKHRVNIVTDIYRMDVFQDFNHNKFALNSGFSGIIFLNNFRTMNVWISYTIKNQTYKLFLGTIHDKTKRIDTSNPDIKELSTSKNYTDLSEQINDYLVEESFSNEKLNQEIIDVIVPVYNGFSYLENLFRSIQCTQMKLRLIIINDCSTEETVNNYLKEYVQNKKNVLLIENEKNLGFVKSVNRGLNASMNHVALVNTDVELPDQWLERLMMPILTKQKVASSTPYTNCGTICSFPKFGKDNVLYEDLPLSVIDNVFQRIKPVYKEIPTGVGFCMGMNKNAVMEIGAFDEHTFDKGYGEENDWCRRAYKSGYKNVHVENLFVYHKHGGSFINEDKKRYLKENSKKLLLKHPEYNRDVALFCREDPNRHTREFVEFILLTEKISPKTTLSFNHCLGGGANSYIEKLKKEILNIGEAFCLIYYNIEVGGYKIQYCFQNRKLEFVFSNFLDLEQILDFIKIKRIIINELVTYPDLYSVMSFIKEYVEKNKIYLTMLIHDYFSLCPTINLLNYQGIYCELPNTEKCNICLAQHDNLHYENVESIEMWRKKWFALLESCDEVVNFSQSSMDLVQKTYEKLNNLKLKPHEVKYMPQVIKKKKITRHLNVGLLGVLVKHKGSEIVLQMLNIIEQKKLPINIILIGNSELSIKSKHFFETGHYTPEQLPRLVLENDIDVFIIPSIWPETFSYTAEEIMKMNFPVICFDLGAPAERIRKYKKGIVLKEFNGEQVVKSLEENYKSLISHYETNYKKILFVYEDETFSMRYRVEHLREQLILQGYSSDCVSVRKIKGINLKKYCSVVIYRCSNFNKIEHIVKQAHKIQKKVFFDIDDYIFDYNAIKDLHFLKSKEYKDFSVYSSNIRKCMSICDEFITSTETLKAAIIKMFPRKEVFLNRNVASLEMLILSLQAKNIVRKSKCNVVLGYFSGSKTHDNDFDIISGVIMNLMDKYDNLNLLVGGQINLPTEFDKLKERIEQFDFVSWESLPSYIAQVDINLMPLDSSFFHSCKSENKWMEAALVNVPTVASYNKELELCIKDEIDGFLCSSREQWVEKLERLIIDETLRISIGTAAHETVIKNKTVYSIESMMIQTLYDSCK